MYSYINAYCSPSVHNTTFQAKFFEYAGIPSDRIHIFGRDSDEIMSFVDNVVSFMDEHMGDHILLIADENLDIVDEVAKHKTISGSQLVEIIRARLLPEQERCLFSLIRSANDSASDIAIYNSRAHGFLPKGKQSDMRLFHIPLNILLN